VIHPVWRGYQTGWLEKLQQLPIVSRTQVEANSYQTSIKRPVGYYWLAMPFYWLGGDSFLGRFYSVRLLSVLIHLLTVGLAYLIGKKVLNSAWLGLTVAGLIAFQPMLSFLSIGVHYDPLAVLWASGFIYLMLERRFQLALLIAVSGLLVKPDLITLLPLWLWLRFVGRKRFWFWLGSAGLLIVLSLLALLNNDSLRYLINLNEYFEAVSVFTERLAAGKIVPDLVNYLTVTGPMHLAQIFPWYWGTFGWLEAPLPGIIFTLLKLVILVSGLGWLKYIFQKGWPKMMTLPVVYSLLQAGLVIANDFQFFVSRQEIYGIQGRYFFPAIVVHMVILVFGLRQWLGEKVLAKSLIGLSLILNLMGLLTLYQYFGNVWQ
jgi:4-amino-4-deoxy-L-arabinose transferase-like glycosyltransferase